MSSNNFVSIDWGGKKIAKKIVDKIYKKYKCFIKSYLMVCRLKKSKNCNGIK
jgi:hypothetical protein